MEVPQLIIDLAIMLSTAAIVTIVFKRLRIPTILGYIVAGFLIGPHFPLFLNIASTSSVETWSEIGVVIILFHIGLEFDFHKIADIGSTAIVSALVKMSGVMFVGYGFGLALGMSVMNSVFLGAMLSISSTVVIQKCFDELGLSDRKFANLVMGSLVMEDVIAVFMMVILTTMAVSKGSGSAGAAGHLALMLCYLIIWLVLGIYFVPTFLDRVMGLMSDEMLTLLSLGFCFLMALLAQQLGFSMELGAFLAGSFFAGTKYVHEVERVTAGIKDMFGAVFFLSVGMMVDPEIIASRWTSIVPIAIIAVVAKLIFATFGMVLSGQDIDTAVRGGTSLAPIGEFSFIIASLGISLGVMDSYLYPVIVASSILTIIFTPVLIRNSDAVVTLISGVIPARLRRKIDSYTSDDQDTEEHTSEWKIVLKDYFIKVAIYGSIMLVTALAGSRYIYPALSDVAGARASRIIVLIVIYLVMIVFTRPYLGNRSVAFTQLWMDRLANRPPLVVMVIGKVAILIIIALIPLYLMFDVTNALILLLLPAAIFLIARSEFIATYYLQLETRFLANLNQKTMEERGGARDRQHWLEEDYSIFSWIVPQGASYAGKSIEELAWGKNEAVYVVKIRKGQKNIAMPPARTVIQTGDKVYVIGDRQSLETFWKTLDLKDKVRIRTLREFLDAVYPDVDHALACAAIQVRGTENYVEKPIKKSGITARTGCMILGLERDGYATHMPDANMLIKEGDILWIIGANNNLSRIAAHSVGKAGLHRESAMQEVKDGER
ncbi:MAG: cation:proton antiporter [Mogibacterium sp.]|nr:cation:proton antiporter [Mogibacterium sp.]